MTKKMLDVWGEGRIIEGKTITGFNEADADNLNHKNQKVSNGPNKGKPIPALVPVNDYDKPSFPIGDNKYEYVTLMGAPITPVTAREMVRVLKQDGAVILYGFSPDNPGDAKDLRNFERNMGNLVYKPNAPLVRPLNQPNLKPVRVYVRGRKHDEL